MSTSSSPPELKWNRFDALVALAVVLLAVVSALCFYLPKNQSGALTVVIDISGQEVRHVPLSDFTEATVTSRGYMLHIAADAPERNVIRIVNPISSNLTIMRSLLAPSLLNVAVTNLKKGNAAGRLFELSNIYVPKQLPLTELPEERLHLGFVAFGEHEDFFAVKGALEDLAASFGVTFEVERAEDVPYLHPGIAAYILCNGVRVGSFGKLANDVQAGLDLPRDSRANQKIFLGEIDYETLVAQLPAGLRYHPLPEFDTVARDLALVADEETPCGTIIAEMKRACKQLADVELFDIYRSEAIGTGKKSMAFTLHFAPENKALEAADVDRFVKKILGNLKFKLGIEIR